MPLPRPWTMPHVEIGMPLIWYHEGNKGSPHACLCTKTGQFGIDVNVFMPDMINTRPLSGVPHVSDPRIGKQSVAESGTWDYPEWLKSLLEMIIAHQSPGPSVPMSPAISNGGASPQASGFSLDQ